MFSAESRSEVNIATAGDVPPVLLDDDRSKASSRLFVTALAVAFLAHLLLIFGLRFSLPNPGSGKGATRPLEIIVLRQAAPSDKKPEIADALAQVDREGGGTERPEEAGPGPLTEIAVPEQGAAQLESLPQPQLSTPQQFEDMALLAQPDSEQKPVPPPKPQPPEHPSEVPPPQVTAAEILASRDLTIAELRSRIQHNSTAYASRKRRKAISASTREYKYASYLEAWRRKVERIGNLNYPDEARRHKMYGSLILHVAVRDDGSIESIRVVRSSGFELLDQAAVKIVELAAPFAPFSPDIRAETDILDITRTWQFLSSNRLGWEN
jgi:periplasmic protein TonB